MTEKIFENLYEVEHDENFIMTPEQVERNMWRKIERNRIQVLRSEQRDEQFDVQ